MIRTIAMIVGGALLSVAHATAEVTYRITGEDENGEKLPVEFLNDMFLLLAKYNLTKSLNV